MNDLVERVGPVLQKCEDSSAIIDAIVQNNADVVVVDRGAYLRVLSLGRCVMPKSAVEQRLGREFRLPSDLELVMPAFKGRLVIAQDHVLWTFEVTER